jgi:hypothetical protein
VFIQDDSKLVWYLRRLLGRSFGAENVNNFFFRFATVSEWRRSFFDVGLCYYDRLAGATRWELVELQLEAQLSDSDSSTGNKSDKSPLHEQKSTQRGVLWSDDWKILQRTEFAFFLSFIATKEMYRNVLLKRIVSIL